MSQYIKGKQIPVASDIARRLDGVREQILRLMVEAKCAGLDDDARALLSLKEHVYDVSSELEHKAREAYSAARRGEELPK